LGLPRATWRAVIEMESNTENLVPKITNSVNFVEF
jgi:hypothetical protein